MESLALLVQSNVMFCKMNLQVSLPMLYAGASTDIGVESVEGLEVTDIA